MAYVTGLGETAFGRIEDSASLTPMAQAAKAALAEAGVPSAALRICVIPTAEFCSIQDHAKQS